MAPRTLLCDELPITGYQPAGKQNGNPFQLPTDAINQFIQPRNATALRPTDSFRSSGKTVVITGGSQVRLTNALPGRTAPRPALCHSSCSRHFRPAMQLLLFGYCARGIGCTAGTRGAHVYACPPRSSSG